MRAMADNAASGGVIDPDDVVSCRVSVAVSAEFLVAHQAASGHPAPYNGDAVADLIASALRMYAQEVAYTDRLLPLCGWDVRHETGWYGWPPHWPESPSPADEMIDEEF